MAERPEPHVTLATTVAELVHALDVYAVSGTPSGQHLWDYTLGTKEEPVEIVIDHDARTVHVRRAI